MDLAHLGIAVDSGPTEKASAALAGFTAEAKKTEQASGALVAAAKRAGISVDEMQKRVANASRNLATFNRGIVATGQTAGLARHQMVNLGYQFNDIASGLVMGQSPFMIMAQQGGQVLQILSMAEGGIGGGLKALQAQIMSFVTPARLLVFSFTAAAGAAAYFISQMTGEDADQAERALEEHARLLGIVKGAYRDAGNAAGDFLRQSRELTIFQAQQNLIALRSNLQSQSRGITSSVSVPLGPGLTDLPMPETSMGMQNGIHVNENMRPFRQAIQDFNDSVARGAPDVVAYREALRGIGQAAQDTNPALAAQANSMIKATDAAEEANFKVQQAEASLRMLLGTATDADRKLLGLTVTKQKVAKATDEERNAYDRMVETVQKRIVQAEIEANTYFMTESAAARYRIEQELIAAAQRAGIPVTEAMRTQIGQLADQYGAVTQRLEDLAEQRARFEAFGDAFKGFVSDLRNGVDASEALGNALNRLADRLIDMALDQAINGLFSNLGGLGFGGGLFGGGGGMGLSLGVPAGLYHGGGTAGSPTRTRYIHPAYFDDAPRYHNGGMAGLAPDEVPAILKRGEPIFRDMQHARDAVGSAMNVSFNVGGGSGDTMRAIRAYVNSPAFEADWIKQSRKAHNSLHKLDR